MKSEKLLDEYIKKINATDSFNYSLSKKFHSKKDVIQNQLLTLLISWKSESSLIPRLQESVNISTQYNKDSNKLKDFLMTKPLVMIQKMFLDLLSATIPKNYTIDEIITLIYQLIGQKKYKGKISEQKIYDYFNEESEEESEEDGGCIKICPKTGKCKIISTCGGIRI